MNQNSNNYLKITIIIFIASFVISSVLYFFGNSGDVKWLDLDNAIKKATESDMPVLLYPNLKWSSKNKIANKSIFSNDTVVNFIHNSFVPAILNIDKTTDKLILKQRFKIENSNYSIVLDKFGRGINFLDNSWSGAMFMNFAKEVLKHPFLKYSSFPEAFNRASVENKHILVFVSNSYFQNVDFSILLKDTALTGYMSNHFVPVAMMTYFEPDIEILKNYYHADDPILKANSEEYFNDAVKYSKGPSEEILIISNTNVMLKRINIGENKESLKLLLEKFINKTE